MTINNITYCSPDILANLTCWKWAGLWVFPVYFTCVNRQLVSVDKSPATIIDQRTFYIHTFMVPKGQPCQYLTLVSVIYRVFNCIHNAVAYPTCNHMIFAYLHGWTKLKPNDIQIANYWGDISPSIDANVPRKTIAHVYRITVLRLTGIILSLNITVNFACVVN